MLEQDRVVKRAQAPSLDFELDLALGLLHHLGHCRCSSRHSQMAQRERYSSRLGLVRRATDSSLEGYSVTETEASLKAPEARSVLVQVLDSHSATAWQGRALHRQARQVQWNEPSPQRAGQSVEPAPGLRG